MTQAVKSSNDEQQIRVLLERWSKGIRNKNVPEVLALYAEGVMLFDLAPPLELTGAEAYKKSLEEWFPTFEGQIGYEITELKINVADDVAFTHSINHLTGKRKDGEATDPWVRATVGLRKIDGKWLVTHEHVSVPFYMDGSLRAAVDLKP